MKTSFSIMTLVVTSICSTASFADDYQTYHSGQQHNGQLHQVQRDRPVLRLLLHVAENAAQAAQIQQEQKQASFDRAMQQLEARNQKLQQLQQIQQQQHGAHSGQHPVYQPQYPQTQFGPPVAQNQFNSGNSTTYATGQPKQREGDWMNLEQPEVSVEESLRTAGKGLILMSNSLNTAQYKLADKTARTVKKEWDHVRENYNVPKVLRPGEASRQTKKVENEIRNAGRAIGNVFGW